MHQNTHCHKLVLDSIAGGERVPPAPLAWYSLSLCIEETVSLLKCQATPVLKTFEKFKFRSLPKNLSAIAVVASPE